jgi:hypothetical protein
MCIKVLTAVLTLVMTGGFIVGAGAASAAESAVPSWQISSLAAPTNFAPGDTQHDYYYEVELANEGGAATDGSPITFVDTLPPGVDVTEVDLWLRTSEQSGTADFGGEACATAGTGSVTVTCVIEEGIVGALDPAHLGPNERIKAEIHVAVPAGMTGPLVNRAEVSGGGAAPADGEVRNQASSEVAPGGFQEFSTRVTGKDGAPTTVAGSHPFQMSTSFAVGTKFSIDQQTVFGASGSPKDIEVTLPPGFVGSAVATPRCTPAQFTLSPPVGGLFPSACPPDSAVGLVAFRQYEGHAGGIGPIYNLVPPKGMPAELGFAALGFPIYIETEVRSDGDYGITARIRNATEAKRVTAATVILWGEPADPVHDRLRGKCSEVGGLCPFEATPKPFLRMPTSCGGPLDFGMTFNSWDHPETIYESGNDLGNPSSCDGPAFDPTIEARPTTTVADSPSGLSVHLHVPQEDDAAGIAPADLRDATVTLPPGLLVNPSSANGLASCSPEQVGLVSPVGVAPARFDGKPARCPAASKIGTVEVTTPLLDHPLPGAVYLAQQSENPFGSLLAIYVAIHDPETGVVVTLAGKVDPNPDNGQLTTTFTGNPQLPFEDFYFKFFEGDRAPLRTPPSCGEFETSAVLTPQTSPQSGGPVNAGDRFSVTSGPNGGCPTGALETSLSAGLAQATAGAFSPFNLRLTRPDASDALTAVSVKAPDGMLAKLAGIPYCPESAIAQAGSRSNPGQGATESTAPSCPGASLVGKVVAGAGAGPSPFFVSGKAYLAGPYKGAPLSLVAVIPAVAGPFDLGVVVDRIALNVDPESAQVSAVGDPFPTILAGIPLDVRDLRVSLDRPDFTLAPTSCRAKSVDVTVSGEGGKTADVSNRFQVGGCEQLKFKPKLKIRLKGSTKHGGFPALKAVLTYPKEGAYANIARAQVNLPHSEFIEQNNLNKTCTRPVLLEGRCPKSTIYGKAKAWTPLLDRPLQGNVYLVGGFGYKLPALVAELNGQIRVLLKGKVDSGPNHGIRNTFEAVPDAPVEKFVLEMKGGPKYSLLVNSENLCKRKQKGIARFTAQNGRVLQTKPVIANDCGKKGKGHGKKAHKKRAKHSKSQKGKARK